MRNHRRRRTSALIKLTVLLLTPFTVAFSTKLFPFVYGFLKKTDEIQLYKNPADLNGKAINEPFYNLSLNEDYEDTINENFDLSVGYGVSEESGDSSAASNNDLSAYNSVSENPGAKPYPTKWTQGGTIVRNTYGKFTGNNYFNLEKAGQVNNKTDIQSATLYNESNLLPEFKIDNSDQPQVLIYHTHTTESFEPFVRDYYDATFNYRTTDETKNVVMIGTEIQKQIEASGIKVIHNTTIHDYPSYNGSYDRSAETIKSIMQQYPSIKVILDIHRDAIAGDGVGYQPFAVINGKEAAQVMIISGCDDGTMNMPDFMKNFRLASLLQQQMETDYPGLTRPIMFDYRNYNQNLSTGALLIEVGSHCNTLDQVKYSGQLIGASIGRALSGLK